ncbi:MAG: M28 family peptidase [Erysipelotrichaceae bacterium]|nr:M28 family peptidase [Erysipelotrichaceae bacterium]
MKKQFLTLLAVALLLCGCTAKEPTDGKKEEDTGLNALSTALDSSYAYDITKRISELGDNPDVGNRSCGSQAEYEAGEIIIDEITKLGLEPVVESFDTDTWSFNKGRIYYTDENGQEQYLVLGGFATNLTFNDEVQVVYVGRGTEADYEGLDVTGKVVLLDIDQANEWWVNHPSYEAYLHGALCALVCNVSGYATYDDDTIGSQDFCGPAYTPAFAVSKNSSKTLQNLMGETGEATVRLDVDSVVSSGTSRNIYTEIKGATDEVIYFFSHYDGYYHTFFDDAQGVGNVLAIAKAIKESGYTPDKTIRFVFHGAEEWGKSDTEYDWSRGAYNMITHMHPEWAENAFAILNIDGMYTVPGHTQFRLACVDELAEFASDSCDKVSERYGLEFFAEAYTSVWTEDFSYIRAGVPSIIANTAYPTEIYDDTAYHSTMDNIALGVDMNAWNAVLDLFADLYCRMDALAVRPMEFTSHFKAMEEVYDGESDLDFAGVYAASQRVDQLVKDMNDAYAKAESAEEKETLRKEAIALNVQLHEMYDFITDNYLALDYDDNTIFPFELNEWNIENLEEAIEALEDGDGAKAYDEYLYGVDYNWYAYEFSKETYAYMLDRTLNKATDTWGEGLIRYPGENLWDVITSVEQKMEQEKANYASEIKTLKAVLKNQLKIQEKIEKNMADLFAETIVKFNEIN